MFVAFPNVNFVGTGGVFHFLIESAMNGQREFINAVAIVDRLQTVPNDVLASIQQTDLFAVAFPYVCLIVAGAGRLGNEIVRIDGQHQVMDAVATINGLVFSYMVTCLANLTSLPCNRQTVGAYGNVIGVAIYRINGKIQDNGAVAVERGLYMSFECVQTNGFGSDIEIIAGISFA